jgi:hypothetical protein
MATRGDAMNIEMGHWDTGDWEFDQNLWQMLMWGKADVIE